jgi:hypothetical protein
MLRNISQHATDTGNWNRKQEILLCGEVAVEGAVDLSWDTQQNECAYDRRTQNIY